jgi:hypothetical protein
MIYDSRSVCVIRHLLMQGVETCGICGVTAENSRSKLKRLVIDHDHTTMKIRGFLCDYCNGSVAHYEAGCTPDTKDCKLGGTRCTIPMYKQWVDDYCGRINDYLQCLAGDSFYLSYPR